MKKKLISIFLITIMIISIVLPSFAETKKELQKKQADAKAAQNELKEQKEDIQEEKKDVMKEVSELSDQISNLENEIDNIKDEISDIQDDINSKQKDLEQKNTELKEKEELLSKRLVAMYMAGDTTYLDFILSGNLVDFMSNYYLISQIADYDKSLIEDVENQKTNIEKEKQSMEEQKTKLENQKSSLYNKNNILEGNKTKKEKAVANLTAEEKAVQAKIDKYYADEKSFENQLRQIEKQEKERERQDRNKPNNGGGSSSPSSQRTFTSNTFKWPCPSSYRITCYFGYRDQPVPGASTYHQGIDIGASTGSAIVAAADGEVTAATYSSSAGNYVMIYHGSGVYTVYMHASALKVSTGQNVQAGQTIALVGSTGVSSGPHLHFGVRVNGSYVNPMSYFK